MSTNLNGGCGTMRLYPPYETFACEFLPNEADCPIFVNADLIAAGLSPFAPELAAFKAGRLMLEAIGEHAQHGENFAFETTLSGLTYSISR